MAKAFGRDCRPPSSRTRAPSSSASSSCWCRDEPPLRRHRHRRRPGRAADGRPDPATGQTVALVERKLIGGTCVNTGCTPTKTLVASAYAAHLARRARDFGVSAGPVSVDFAAVMARKDQVVGNSRHLTAWLQGMASCTLIEVRRVPVADEIKVGDDALSRAHLHQRRLPGRRADFPGLNQVTTAEQHDGARTRRPALAPRHRRRQLCRPRIRANASGDSAPR